MLLAIEIREQHPNIQLSLDKDFITKGWEIYTAPTWPAKMEAFESLHVENLDQINIPLTNPNLLSVDTS